MERGLHLFASSSISSICITSVGFEYRYDLGTEQTNYYRIFIIFNRESSYSDSCSPSTVYVAQFLRHIIITSIELGKILHQGSASRAEYLDADLRQRISVVKADVAPDLRQARISISVSGSFAREDTAMDKRRAYA